MNISTSAKVESSQDEIPDCEWHTKDPITGELFFLSKGVLYSKLPSNTAQRILSINPKEISPEEKKEFPKNKNKSIYLSNSAKFSSVYKGNKVQIFGGNSIANSSSQSEGLPQENYAIVTNIAHVGIVMLEFICPISLSNLGFGMISEKDLLVNNISKQFKVFKTSSRRNLIMKINYWDKRCSFYLNDTKVSSIYFNEGENIPIILIKKKSSCVILNPLVKYYVTTLDSFFKKEILFKINKKEKILNQNGEKDFLNFFQNSFRDQKFNLKYGFGDINDQGEICNFICAKFDKNFSNELKKNFDKICSNKNISLVDKKTLTKIKKNLTISEHLTYLNDITFLSKLRTKFIKEEKENKDNKENKESEEDFINNVVKYIIENFENIEINKKESFAELKKEFEEFKEKTNLLENLKPFNDKEINEKGNYNSFIDYVKNEDCLLMINKNKLKIIKREENGLFDLTNFIDLKNKIFNSTYIIFEKTDLLYFLQNFDIKGYINYYPNFNKIHCLFSFLNSIKNAFSLGDSKVIILQPNSKYFYTSIISFLNFSAFVTKRKKFFKKKFNSEDKDLNIKQEKEKSAMKSDSKEKIEKDNFNIKNIFPFAFDNDTENEIESEEVSPQLLEESTENILSTEDYNEFIVRNPLIHAKLVKIVNKIMAQISIRNPDTKLFGNNNIYNSYENMASFINYPFISKEPDFPFTSLSDNGFYCENAFTNELKLYDYQNSKLIDTDMLSSNENIELYLKENIPTYINNSPLKDLSPIIKSSYTINNMNFLEEPEKIELYHINEKYPLIATCSKNGIVNIYSYSLGIKKLGSVNIFKGIKKPKNLSEIGDIFVFSENKSNLQNIKSIEEFLMNKKTLIDNGKKGEKQVKFLYNKDTEVKVNEDSLKKLIQMGFNKEQCVKALKEKKNNFEEALEYILSNPMPVEPKVESNGQKDNKNFIGKWSCPACTYINTGLEKCEMCDTRIPDEVYDKFLSNYTKEVNAKKEKEKKEAKKEEKKEEKKEIIMKD